MWNNIRAIIIVLSVPILLTGLSVWCVPILWVQGSSAAFNFAGFLVIMTLGLWGGAWYLLSGWYKENKKK